MHPGRVRTRRDFACLRQHGRRSRQHTLRVVHVPAAGEVRVAFAVGRQVGPAVVRNRVRRRLRAAVGELSPAPGLYLITTTPAAARQSYSDLCRVLAEALHEVGAR